MNGTTVVIGVRYFRVERPWGILPAGRSLGAVSELALDSKGNAGPCALCFTAAGDRIQGSAVETAGARRRNKVRIAGARLESEPMADGVARPGDEFKRQ